MDGTSLYAIILHDLGSGWTTGPRYRAYVSHDRRHVAAAETRDGAIAELLRRHREAGSPGWYQGLAATVRVVDADGRPLPGEDHGQTRPGQ